MIDALKIGSVVAFQEVYILYREKLFAYFLKKTNNEEDAKDLLQTTFSRLWQYRTTLSNNYLLDQHIFYIARTVFIDYLRKQNKSQKVHAGLNVSALQLSDNIGEFDLRLQLQKILCGMPAVRRRVFELHKLQGYSYKDIAGILAISIKSVDNNLTKALKCIRSELIFLLILLINIH